MAELVKEKHIIREPRERETVVIEDGERHHGMGVGWVILGLVLLLVVLYLTFGGGFGGGGGGANVNVETPAPSAPVSQ